MMREYPKIQLKIDIETDISNCISFVKRHLKGEDKNFLSWFLPDDFQFIVSKKFSEKEREKIIREYTKHIYKIKHKEINRGLERAKKDWGNVEDKYFKLVDNIFNGFNWNKDSYIGIISIFSMYPRWLNKGIFFLPYKHKIPKYSNRVIAHEMLHFIFFDYLYKKYKFKEHSEIKNKPDDYIWKVSEVFNNVIEDWKPYNKIFRDKIRLYPDTKKMFNKMQKQWQKKKDVDWLLSQWF